jgi:hypothetical protein
MVHCYDITVTSGGYDRGIVTKAANIRDCELHKNISSNPISQILNTTQTQWSLVGDNNTYLGS